MSGSLKNGLTLRSVSQRGRGEQGRLPEADRLIENSSYLKLVVYSSTAQKGMVCIRAWISDIGNLPLVQELEK